MAGEKIPTIENPRERITRAIEKKDAIGLERFLEDLILALGGEWIYKDEMAEDIQDRISGFLNDPLKMSLLVRVDNENSDVHLTIYKEKGGISFDLRDDGNKKLKERWEKLSREPR